VLTHGTLLAKVWGREYVDEVDYLRVYVRRLRDKLGDDPDRPRYIRTERGLGYRFLTPSEAGPIDLSASEEESPGGAEK
jgi:two-component system KDP operon response regulator KdpE